MRGRWEEGVCDQNGPLRRASRIHLMSVFRGVLVPGPEIKPTAPALEGEVLTSGLPGKPQALIYSLNRY